MGIRMRSGYSSQNVANISVEGLVLTHVWLVQRIAKKILAGLPARVKLDDLVQDGVCGLIGAARRWDGRRGVPFSLYAKHRIRGAILDGLRRGTPGAGALRRKAKRLHGGADDLGNELGRDSAASEVAAGTSPRNEQRRPGDWCASGTVYAWTESGSAELSTLSADETWRPDVQAGRVELRAVLWAAMKSLPVRYQQIMLLYYWRGFTMGEIGRVLGVQQSRVSQIHKRALERMAGCLVSSGITSLNSLLP